MTGIDLIAAERKRQIDDLGYSQEHDQEHDAHDLAFAAACYASPTTIYLVREHDHDTEHHAAGLIEWVEPWPPGWSPRTRAMVDNIPDRIRELAKAGALIAAEIDRLQSLDG